MARVTVEDCLEQVPNRFALVLMVAKRAKQIMKGSDCTVPARNNKNIVASLREVAAGNVVYESSLSRDMMVEQIQKDLNK